MIPERLLKWTILIAIGIGLQAHSVDAQVRISNIDELQVLKQTPLETLYVHPSATLLFPGEYLYYSLYCINTQTYKLSNISEIAYVQILNEANEILISQKVFLRSGRGQGDIFLGTNLPSGNYKLVAFTHWMKNAGARQFFMQNISFINPYTSKQGGILSTADSVRADSIARIKSGQPLVSDSGSSDLAIMLEKSEYSTEEEVVVSIRNFKGKLGHGSYSLLIRKQDELPHPAPIRTTRFAESYPSLKKEIPQSVNSIVSIPEQRGELISGRVLNKTGEPQAGLGLAISLPGKDFQIKTAQTDSEGKFYTYLIKPFNGNQIIVDVLNPVTDDYRIELDKPSQWDPDLDNFFQLQIGPQMAERIRKRSVHNQIENSYFELKPDSILMPPPVDPFDGEQPETYDLDDYTRFSSLRETLIEIIAHVDLKRTESGDTSFWVQPPQEYGNQQVPTDPPLVTLDGVLIQDLPSLLNFDARQLKYVRVLRDPYVMGSSKFQGMVALETISGDFAANYNPKAGGAFAYDPPRPFKNYFRHAYAKLPGHIPDYRTVLLWVPKLEISQPEQSFTFKTSGVPGTYEIRLEGFTAFGKPISLMHRVVVK
ncbi:hypothetical protein ACT6NV_13185 [Robiginitalea sp. IMCC44478]|uniref:hypothetical protein n=1 Tax=Robiginitalea sp. IMCC44478 TaxID=3459122 RepID=UPI0040410676